MSELDSGIVVFAPSYRRGDRRSTTQEYLPFVTLVVADKEAAGYRATGNRVITCPDAVQGNASRVRNWILEQYRGARGVVMMDDDYSSVMRWRGRDLVKLTPEEVEEMIEQGFLLAEEWGAYLWGMNCTVDKGAYREYTPFSTTSFIGGPFQAHRPNRIRYDESLPLKEDYDITLQHLNEHRRVLRLNMYVYQVKQNEQTGGCAVYRTIKSEKEQFGALAKKWGDHIVRIDGGQSKKMVRGGKDINWDINPIIHPPIAGV